MPRRGNYWRSTTQVRTAEYRFRHEPTLFGRCLIAKDAAFRVAEVRPRLFFPVDRSDRLDAALNELLVGRLDVIDRERDLEPWLVVLGVLGAFDQLEPTAISRLEADEVVPGVVLGKAQQLAP